MEAVKIKPRSTIGLNSKLLAKFVNSANADSTYSIQKNYFKWNGSVTSRHITSR